MPTIECKKCDKTFTHRSQTSCDSALRMHVGREHTKKIRAWGQAGHKPSNGAVIVAEDGEGNNGHSLDRPVDRRTKAWRKLTRAHRLTPTESNAVISFIRERRKEFRTKIACFIAAAEAAGVANKIKANSVAADRYFKKAKGVVMRKKYTRRVVRTENPVQGEVLCFCPRCGLNVAVAKTAMIVALRHS